MNASGNTSNSSSVGVVASAPADCAPLQVETRQASWASWVLPSFADIFFIVLFALLLFTPISATLLADADTGWHIRNGEIIMATHAVPRVDSFSYTRAGQPWYAWEWLYDVIIGAIHHVSGLNGVVLFTALVLALTFALLFRFVLRRSGNFAVAAGLTLLAAAAAQIHMLARPHVLSWLFTLLWVEALYRFEEGNRIPLFCLPGLMLLWVNLHGGFIMGLVLIALFGCAHVWNYLTNKVQNGISYEGKSFPRQDEKNFPPQPSVQSNAAQRTQILQLAITFVACLAVTFLTPYGYKLHVHVYQYLSNSYLMNAIYEFQSPNFHAARYGYFECFILLCVAGVALAIKRVTATDLLLILFSLHASLYAARNIPLAAIMMSLALGPLLSGAISPRNNQPSWMRSLLDCVHDISENMGGMEKSFRGHALAIAVVAASMLLALSGGRIFSAQILSAHFDEKRFPVKAAEFIASRGIHDHMFNLDQWSGYLIYRLYPGTKVYMDDRHDFYGEAFIKELKQASNATWKWREPLDKYQVKWVLIDTDSPLATVLKESKSWQVEYDDGLAIIFSRIS